MHYFRSGFITRPPLLVTWNPGDKTSNIFLSGSNLTAEFTSGGSGGVRASVPRRTGKYYCELKTVVINKPGTCVGLANSTRNLAATMFDDNALNAIVQFWGGAVYKNGAFTLANTSLGTNTILRVAFDADNRRVWFAVDAGLWNADASADPETNVLGQLTAGFDDGGLFPVFGGADNAQNVVGNFGASAFTYAIPTGFSAWNAS